jgi:hypothetical protein
MQLLNNYQKELLHMDNTTKQSYSDLIDAIVRQDDPSKAINQVLAARLSAVAASEQITLNPLPAAVLER